ncbi:pilus assembly protein PilW [Vibrio sp. FNV 38]|nr:pilus assembly protein PilW [Vibrio sp. FNV 38]
MNSQAGTSLIELMIASALSVIALAIISSIYINGQKVVTERYKQLVLMQNTESVLQMLSNDLQRAGYDGNQGHSLKMSGADNTIFTQNGTDSGLVAYAYRVDLSGATPIYKNVVYQQRSGASEALFVCEKKRDTVMTVSEAVDLVGTRICYQLFDKRVIKVTDFDITNDTLGGEKAKSAIVSVRLSTSFVDQPSIAVHQEISITQRNWQ